MVQILWTTFTYEFAGEFYVQSKGGPIGARITMAASRLVMQEWSERYTMTLRTSLVEMWALRGYVDDIRQMSEVMRRGTRFNKQERRYMWREDWEREDIEKNEPDEVRMGKICLEGMNSVSNLTFTVETAEDFQNKMLPTLDLQIEVKQAAYRKKMIDQISFTYFQKAMKTPLVDFEPLRSPAKLASTNKAIQQSSG